ncbi:MAG TPA: DUF721 domain-containing protein [Candidatus Magasanikbacteria bacterium]|nr:DUF721 domain-containing protein [Candidatus Magasanikbacteria bacterium]
MTIPSTLSSIGDTLKNKFGNQAGVAKGVEAAQIIEVAQKIMDKIFSPELAALMKPLFMKNRTLTISCSSSAVAQELRLHQNEVVELMNKEIGRNEIDRVRYLC